MSKRLSFSSTKNGPSVSAAVRTHVALPVVGVVVPLEVVSVTVLADTSQLASSDCDTNTLAAPSAAKPSRSRRLSWVSLGDNVSMSLPAMGTPQLHDCATTGSTRSYQSTRGCSYSLSASCEVRSEERRVG